MYVIFYGTRAKIFSSSFIGGLYIVQPRVVYRSRLSAVNFLKFTADKQRHIQHVVELYKVHLCAE